MKKKKFWCRKSRTGLLPKCVVTHSLCCDLGAGLGCWACRRWQALGARRACRRACVGARARAQVGAMARRRQGRAGAGALVADGPQAFGLADTGGRASWRGARQADAG